MTRLHYCVVYNVRERTSRLLENVRSNFVCDKPGDYLLVPPKCCLKTVVSELLIEIDTLKQAVRDMQERGE